MNSSRCSCPSGPEDPDTLRLDRPIINDKVSESGRPIPWVQGHRYASLADLTRPGVTVTSQLVAKLLPTLAVLGYT